MPLLNEAYWRHANLYLYISEKANTLFINNKTNQALILFDLNRNQITNALNWIVEKEPTDKLDLLYIQYMNALSLIGLIRFSVRGELIPYVERKITIAQRLNWIDMEVDSFDELGIIYAYLGYIEEASDYFEKAYEIASKIEDVEFSRVIQKHMHLATKQIKPENSLLIQKSPNIFKLIKYQVKLLWEQYNKNFLAQITIHNSLANNYLSFKRPTKAIWHLQKSLSISKKFSYDIGVIESSLGLLQANIVKDRNLHNSIYEISDMAEDFEWSDDLKVLDTLCSIIPIIQNAEIFANQLGNNSTARLIFCYLDAIMEKENNIVSLSVKIGIIGLKYM